MTLGRSTSRWAPLVAIATVASLAGAPPAAALAPDRTAVVRPAAPIAWTGPTATGVNAGFDPATAAPCGKTPPDFCDVTLVDVVPGDFYERARGGVEFSTRQAQDVDLFVYASDAAGTLGELVGASAGATGNEFVSVVGGSGHFLVVAVYYAVGNAGYAGRAAFFRRNRVPFDVDDPPGLQETPASDPGRGWRSRSETHVAQSPTNPRVLVAASKLYNRDRDSLAEYEFKVGSYASFDRAQSWADLGQIDTCSQAQAPPALYPLRHTCYPADDPRRGGTGPEDAGDDRGQGDVGEEYLTSDPWVDFDDEGNAYAMVLDSPPLPSGSGWGMSLHRWESVSAGDVRRGETWSDRIIINAYDTPEEQAAFLDDKNSFAVNNAGPDGDGRTGIIVGCWGQNYDLANLGRQRIVCERSVDGGRSWPDEPQPISAPLERPLPFGPFLIGVHVVADTRDPNTFYAVWLDTLSGFLPGGGGRSPLWFTKTTDGARTWRPARIIQRIDQVPNIFPRQSFRTLSLPIMAVGPRSELFVAWPDYDVAPYPGSDEDGFQADIHLTASLDAGTSWSTAAVVNRDVGNADQFQPYIRATTSGQLNVLFFDRRRDRPEGRRHVGNFFIDNVLARSDDLGVTWREVRLSHDSWDPSINPPQSTSGEFIGDYQGLAADDCYAIPFLNDTHLANRRSRDPAFDAGLPRSELQQAFSYRVPNVRERGGAFPAVGASGDVPDGCDRTRPPRRFATATAPVDRIRILSARAVVDARGRFAVRLGCPRAAQAPCSGTVTAKRRGARLAGSRFRINRRTRADVSLRLDRRGRARLAARGSLAAAIAVVPQRTVARGTSTARVELVLARRRVRASVSGLTRAQARRLVAKYRVIANAWTAR